MMLKKILFACSAFAFATAPALADSGWTYSTEYGHHGPHEWAGLKTDNVMCAGKNQTPIEINATGTIRANLAPISFKYPVGGNELWNNGHTLQVNFPQGSTIEIDGTSFKLLQFHFHTPSENKVNGKLYAMEMHLVHADAAGNLAVVGVMFDEGGTNPALDRLLPLLPIAKDQKKPIAPAFDANSLLPPADKRSYYRFSGSLTTPPCSEGVRWFVMKQALPISQTTLQAIKNSMLNPNNRPLQQINGRPVLE